MGVVVEFRDLVRERRRRREREAIDGCIEILRASVDFEQRMVAVASDHDRAVHLHRVEKLSELLAYVERHA